MARNETKEMYIVERVGNQFRITMRLGYANQENLEMMPVAMQFEFSLEQDGAQTIAVLRKSVNQIRGMIDKQMGQPADDLPGLHRK